MAFADVLKELRARDNMTQVELAEQLGISKSAVSMYEQGEREPNFETMEAIADTFNVPMDRLYGRDRGAPAAEDPDRAQRELLSLRLGRVPTVREMRLFGNIVDNFVETLQGDDV